MPDPVTTVRRRMQAVFQGMLGSRRLLGLWCETQRSPPLPVRDYHLVSSPDGAMLFHAPSCRAVHLDPLLEELFRLRLASDRDAGPLLVSIASRHSTSALAQGVERYASLSSVLSRLTTPPPSPEEPEPQKGELLMFGNLTCNMACPYCLSREARAEASAGTAPKLMPLKTAEKSIQFIAERMKGRVQNVYVNFTLGGEPLLSMDRYQYLREYCAAVSTEAGVQVTLNMNTNGTAFTDSFLKYCEESGVLMAVSIDGPREVHDRMRPFLSGKGTYDSIVSQLPQILESEVNGLRHAAAGAVLTALNPYPRQVYQHLIELGFRHVVVTPVRDFPGEAWSLNESTTKAFQDGYTEYAEWMLECLVNEDDRIYAAIIEHDFFARFLIRLVRGSKQAYRCEAGRTTFGVSVDGGLYPCDNFVKLPQYRLGDVFSGIDEEKQTAFLDRTMVDEKPVCRDCWARYQCGGGCYFTAALNGEDHRIPQAAKCDLIRHCVELGLGILAGLERQNPAALRRLQSSVWEAESYVVAPSVGE